MSSLPQELPDFGSKMSSLPQELLIDILARLPVESLLHVRCVCKTWWTLVSAPDFIKLHLNQTIQTDSNHNIILNAGSELFQIQPPFSSDSPNQPRLLDFDHFPVLSELVGSCNGLICLSTPYHSITLLNPSTKKYKESPVEPVQYPGRAVSRYPIYGFGYDSTIDEYKVVRISYYCLPYFPVPPYLSNVKSEVKVYRLATNSWTTVGDIPADLCSISQSSSAVLANGSLHWIGTGSHNSSSESLSLDIPCDIIVSFSIKHEEFREMTGPPNHFKGAIMRKFLMVMNGYLCMFRFSRLIGDVGYEIWVMKDYGVRESWIKHAIIGENKLTRFSCYFKPLVFFKNGDQILIEGSNGKLVLYDLKKEICKSLVVGGSFDGWVGKVTYVGSLVSLKSKWTSARTITASTSEPW